MARHQQKHREKVKAHTSKAALAADEAGDAGREVRAHAKNMADRTSDVVQDGTRQFAVIGEKAFEAWIRTSDDALRRVVEMNVELAAWGQEQVDDGLNAVRSLAQCRTVGDAYGVQLGLMRSSMEKSIRHAGNVLNLAAHAMAEGTRVR